MDNIFNELMNLAKDTFQNNVKSVSRVSLAADYKVTYRKMSQKMSYPVFKCI